MKRSNIYLIFTYIFIMFIGGFLGYLELSVKQWEFWVLLISVVIYGLFNELKGEWSEIELRLMMDALSEDEVKTNGR